MKTIINIARTELRNLFYSPVAWFLAVVFLVMCGVFYTGALETYTKVQEALKDNSNNFKDFGASLTDSIFMRSGFFTQILHNLYLFVPLLTMGIISREHTNGTVKLLYSSPVKIRQIVFGKYLAVMLFNMILLSFVLIFVLLGSFDIKDADTGKLLAGSLGFYLLFCTYTALGMFMSSLSNYQVVSAIATFTVVFALNSVGGLWQQYDLVRDLTYVLSMSGRADMMLYGLITTKDIVYFLLIIGMFLGFTMLRLKFSRLLLPWFKKTGAYLGIFLLVVILGYLTSRPGYIGYWDTTANKEMTISPQTRQIIAGLGDEPVEVTLYTNLLDYSVKTLPKSRQEYVWAVWDRYVRFKPNIKFNYAMYYDVKDGDSTIYRDFKGKTLSEIAGIVAKMFGYSPKRFMPPAEIRKIVDLEPENYRSVMHLKYKDRSVFLRTYSDVKYWPDEQHFAAAFKYLADGKGPKMYFVSGHFERSIHKEGSREYNAATIQKLQRAALINHAYTVDTLSIEERDVPADAEILVLADPKSILSEQAQQRIQSYLQKGGNMIVAGEPGKQEMVNPVLRPLGVQLGKGTVVEITNNEMPHVVQPYITWAATELAAHELLEMQQVRLSRGLDTFRMNFTGTTNLELVDSGFTVKHLAVTAGRNAWVKVGQLVVDSAAPVFNPAEGDYTLDSASTMVSLSRKINNKEQRILVLGDGDVFSKTNLGALWFWDILNSWLNYEKLPVIIASRPPKDTLLLASSARANVLHWIFVWILPAILLIIGTILLIRRKRK